LVGQSFARAIEVSFIWRSKEGADYPGQAAIMTFEPRQMRLSAFTRLQWPTSKGIP
jgi:hypothetical protein